MTLTGFRDLDELTGGFSAGDLVFLTGQTATGKTSFALNMALFEAQHHGAVGFYSLEMNEDRMLQRLVSAVSSASMQDVANGKLKPSDWRSLVLGIQGLIKSNLYIDCSVHLSAQDVGKRTRRTSIERLRTGQNPMSFIIVDYLQLMIPFGHDTEQRDRSIAQIVHGLKAVAQNLGVCVLLIGQLDNQSNRVNRHDNQPVLSNLRERGVIEQCADTVLLLQREDSASPDPGEYSPAEVIVATHPFGRTGRVQLEWLNDLRGFRTKTRRPATGKG